jgi:hypothetical protein
VMVKIPAQQVGRFALKSEVVILVTAILVATVAQWANVKKESVRKNC